MCTTCGCGDPEIVPVELHEKILAGNDRTAAHNRAHFAELGVLALNLMGSPGSGKTAVLEATARGAAAKGWRLAAVSADLATDHDARRLEKAGIPSRAITTGQACHLDAELVHRAMHGFPLDGADVFFIENVGNLVCPAIYDLGQRANVVVLSITEGEDKPLKYPVMFKAADLVLLTKCDLAPHLDVDLARIHDAVARVMPRPRVIEVSARTGAGLDAWIAWLEELRAAGARPARAHPHVHDHHGHRHEEGAHAGDDAHDHAHAHAHAHDHEHEHRHGRVAHAHPHAHVHVHPHGGGDASASGGTDHAHAGSAGHDHPHGEAPAPARGRTARRKAKAPGRSPARVAAGKVARGPARKRAAARTGRPGAAARRRRGR